MLVFILRLLWNFGFLWKPKLPKYTAYALHTLLTYSLAKRVIFTNQSFSYHGILDFHGILNYVMLRLHIVYLALRRLLFLKRMPISSQDVARNFPTYTTLQYRPSNDCKVGIRSFK